MTARPAICSPAPSSSADLASACHRRSTSGPGRVWFRGGAGHACYHSGRAVRSQLAISLRFIRLIDWVRGASGQRRPVHR